jgi:hypothetical protein
MVIPVFKKAHNNHQNKEKYPQSTNTGRCYEYENAPFIQ